MLKEDRIRGRLVRIEVGEAKGLGWVAVGEVTQGLNHPSPSLRRRPRRQRERRLGEPYGQTDRARWAGAERLCRDGAPAGGRVGIATIRRQP
jgi:hypothetical protein